MSRAFLLAVPLLTVSLAGCLTDGGSLGKEVAAPAWAAGHTWTYHLTTSATEMGDDFDREEESGDLTLTVYNTQAPMQGRPVYYATSSERYDHPVWMGSQLAFDQETLRIVGVGDSYDYGHSPPHMVDEAGLDPKPPANPCIGIETIRVVDADEAFPAPRFPLTAGAVDRGTWGEDGDFEFAYVMRTDGPVKVEVPAGSFDAYRVTIDLSPSIGFNPGGEMPSFRIRAEYYYAPAAENYVKIDLSASMRGFGDFEGFEYHSATDLASFELAQAAESTAPIVESDTPKMRWEPLSIVTDQAPQNVAQGPITARFALRSGPVVQHQSADGMSYAIAYAPGGVQVVSDFPGASPLDADTQTVYWVLSGPDHGAVQSFVGPVAEFTIESAAQHNLRAEVIPTVCGAPWLGSAYGSFANFWEKSWTVKVEPGPARVIDVASFPVDGYLPTNKLSVKFAPSLYSQTDGGNALFTAPGGNVYRSTGGSVSGLYDPGEWTLQWEAKGRDLAVAGLAVPATVGDDVELSLRLDYSQGF